MRSSIFVGLISLLGIAVTVSGQTSSRAPGNSPFTIEKGASFQASTGDRRATSVNNERSIATATITEDVRQAMKIIRDNHVAGSSVGEQQIMKSSINSMLAELDPHSNYLDAAEFAALLGEHESEYSGTGSSISNFLRDGRVETYIVATHTGSSAARAGLRYGDRIVSIDGQSVEGLIVDIVRDRIRGPRGTTVRVVVERAATGTVEILDLRRERVHQPSIPNFTIVSGSVGYVAISNGFTVTTGTELNSAIKELRRRGMKSLILDLRGNGGGILDQAIAVAEKFLPTGSSIISQRGRNKFDNRAWSSQNSSPENMPLVVLVDRRTASASEIVAGALQDNDRALILGENTFGKGLVQNVVELPMGSGLTLTTARYYTPSGRSLQREYDSASRYDYFLSRSAEASNIASSTLTNRRVYGGRGLTPDQSATRPTFNATQSAMIDPIFFFVRDLTATADVQTDLRSIGRRDQIRQSIIFGNDPLPPEIMSAFRSYVRQSTNLKLTDAVLDTESGFIQGQLRYQLTLSAFGAETAETVMLGYDDVIAQAVQALPTAERLAESARRLRAAETAHKKTRQVAFPAGQGRNRRN